MKLYTAEQIRSWDAYTIANEPVSSIDLMERAATACATWIDQQDWKEKPFPIFCGKGNNGGDGLAIARLLLQQGYYVETYVLELGKSGSQDFEENLRGLHAISEDIHFLQDISQFPFIEPNSIIIDALFGSGLNKSLEGISAALVKHLNAANAPIVAIDVPSGLFTDRSSLGNKIIQAAHTLTFQTPKIGLLVQENAPFIGEVTVLPIGLHPQFAEKEESPYEWVNADLVKPHYQQRHVFSHKGTFGHALLAVGSWGKIGAAVLAAKACLRSGVGLLTCHLPACGYGIMQTAVPEAMALTDSNATQLTRLPGDLQRYNAIGVGPGIGTDPLTQQYLKALLTAYRKPMVLDADALNCLAAHPDWLNSLPPYSILTPHSKEFDRLFGAHHSDFDRLATARQQAIEKGLIILLKGHHTAIAIPSGKLYFNSTGNAGMAKGGSGDVLTGILTSLLAQGYLPAEAAVLGVYLHGAAGDLCAASLGMESMLPSDLVMFLGGAFRELKPVM